MSLKFEDRIPEYTSKVAVDNWGLGGGLTIEMDMTVNKTAHTDFSVNHCYIMLSEDQVRQLMDYCGQTLAGGST